MSYADVNGLHLYYEEHGAGEQTLMLLHGGFGATELLGAKLPALAAGRRVVAVDLQGHGRTADIDRPIRLESMGDDIAALIRHLDAGPADVMGYSLGGGVAARTAIQHHDLVRRLVLVSVPFRHDAWFPEVLAGMARMGDESAEMMKQSPLYEMYARVAPRIEDWPTLHRKMRELLTADYDWTAEVSALPMPVQLFAADADSFPPAHAAEFFALLGGGLRDAGWDGAARPASRLAILPNATHYDVFDRPEITAAAIAFLDA
jgi:pimeloyl-ACP methyl ester carboxylesterase